MRSCLLLEKQRKLTHLGTRCFDSRYKVCRQDSCTSVNLNKALALKNNIFQSKFKRSNSCFLFKKLTFRSRCPSMSSPCLWPCSFPCYWFLYLSIHVQVPFHKYLCPFMSMSMSCPCPCPVRVRVDAHAHVGICHIYFNGLRLTFVFSIANMDNFQDHIFCNIQIVKLISSENNQRITNKMTEVPNGQHSLLITSLGWPSTQIFRAYFNLPNGLATEVTVECCPTWLIIRRKIEFTWLPSATYRYIPIYRLLSSTHIGKISLYSYISATFL
jgi:hypothetical protein